MKGIIISSIALISILISGKQSINSTLVNSKIEKCITNEISNFDVILEGKDTSNFGIFTDERDNKKYKWVRVGNQIWMAQNLAFKAESGCSPFRWKKRKSEKEGYLYEWETAQRVAPKGWHLASEKEYLQLIKYIGGTNQVNTYKYLIEGDIYGFHFKNNGAYWANFPKKGKGMYNGGSFHPVKQTVLWTSSYGLSYHKDTMYTFFGIRYREKVSWVSSTGDKLDRYPIRCIKD